MPHINDTDTTRSGAQMDSPANTPYRRTNSNTAAASMAFMLRTAVFCLTGIGAEEAAWKQAVKIGEEQRKGFQVASEGDNIYASCWSIVRL